VRPWGVGKKDAGAVSPSENSTLPETWRGQKKKGVGKRYHSIEILRTMTGKVSEVSMGELVESFSVIWLENF